MVNQEQTMNAMIDTLEARRMMSASVTHGTPEVTRFSPPAAHALPYVEQANVHNRTTTAGQPKGIIGVLIALVRTPTPKTAAAGARSAATSSPAVTGDWNGDGRDALGATRTSAGYKMTDVMISSVVGKTTQRQVFAGAAGTQAIMIRPVVDGTSNTLMF
jgi:hypothetical protein